MGQLLHIFLRNGIEFRNNNAYIMAFLSQHRSKRTDDVAESSRFDKRN